MNLQLWYLSEDSRFATWGPLIKSDRRGGGEMKGTWEELQQLAERPTEI